MTGSECSIPALGVPSIYIVALEYSVLFSIQVFIHTLFLSTIMHCGEVFIHLSSMTPASLSLVLALNLDPSCLYE